MTIARGTAQGFLEHRLIALPLRRRQVPVEIGVERAKGELAAIGILKQELAVADDPGTVQDAARLPRAR